MLVDLHDSLHATIFKDSTHDCLKHVAKNLWRLERLNFALVQGEVRLHEGELEVVVHVFLRKLLLSVVEVDDILMEAQHDCEFGQDLIRDQLLLCLMSIRAVEVLAELVNALCLRQVTLKQRET